MPDNPGNSNRGGSENNSDNIDIFYRMPPVKRFHVDQFALTLGLLFVYIMMGYWRKHLGFDFDFTQLITFGFIIHALEVLANSILIIWLFTKSVTHPKWNKCLFPVTSIIFLLNIFLPREIIYLNGNLLGIWRSIFFLSSWFFAGFIVGWIFSILYNLKIFRQLHRQAKREHHKNISFAYRKDRLVNVLKSPIKGEEITLEDEFENRKMYKFEPTVACTKPYTIAFVATPGFFDKEGKENEDPIKDDLPLFLHSIDRALRCFEEDEVLGRPEIWSRVRIVTIFDNNAEIEGIKENVLVGESSHVYTEYYKIPPSDPIVTKFIRVITPIQNHIQEFINKYKTDSASYFGKEHLDGILDDIDVVYVLTANLKYDRSSAIPSSGEKSTSRNEIDLIPTSDSSVQEPTWVEAADVQEGGQGVKLKTINHEIQAEIPGMIALNVVSARQKTIMHEFAHAMAHDENGALVDEYFEMDHITDLVTVNRLLRDTNEISIPKDYAKYNNVQYYSDRNHPSDKEYWQSFFPLREAKHIGCTMDRTIGPYQFDQLISAFMYDRLINKIR